MLSHSSKDLIKLTIEHRALQAKFNEYYQKSDAYIKEQTQKLEETEAKYQKLTDDFASFD
jgi:hypothetical protein